MKPLIGITTSLMPQEDWEPKKHGQNETYSQALIRAKALPVLIPLTDDKPTLRGLYERLDGILLAGGVDLETPPNLRDRTELTLIGWALEDGKPLLGICRGLQMINQALGGQLYQDIATEVPGALNHRASRDAKTAGHVAGNMNIEPKSRLGGWLGTSTVSTNEFHHQAVKQLGQGLKAVGWSSDGLIEAIESDDNRFVVGVQCHPESLVAHAEPRWRPLFTAFIAAATKVPMLY